eukprot:7065914-Pyramimonas_sp.AAC.1
MLVKRRRQFGLSQGRTRRNRLTGPPTAAQAEQKERWEQEREKAIGLGEQVKQLQGQLQNQAACMEKERKQSILKLAVRINNRITPQ